MKKEDFELKFHNLKWATLDIESSLAMSIKQKRKMDNPSSSLGSRTPTKFNLELYDFNQATFDVESISIVFYKIKKQEVRVKNKDLGLNLGSSSPIELLLVPRVVYWFLQKKKKKKNPSSSLGPK